VRTVALVLALAAAGPRPAPARQDAAERLQKKIEACSKHITERFVFFGGGSGVLISEDGYCLTNHHVAGAQATTRVTLHSGQRVQARRVCTDERGDLSLFKLEGAADEKFPFAEFGDSDKLEAGQYVIACGNPFGITLPAEDRKWYPTITLGIVSALHRRQGDYFDCIQTDAAVNPGNSGGPLVTLDGKLVGINGRIATRYMNRVNSGVGYAIPSVQIQNFLPAMKQGGQGGKIHHGQINGLLVGDLNTQGQGARVMGVGAGTTAEKAGFRKGDLVTAVNGYPVFNRERFGGVVGTYPEGTEIAVTVKRADETLGLKARLDRYTPENPFAGLAPPRPAPSRPKGSGYLGVFVEEENEAVAVKDVRPGSPADEAGLRPGDVFLKAAGRTVKTRDELNAVIWARRPGQKLKLSLRRDGQDLDVEVVLGKHPDD
jgi:serine protease Do